MGSIGYNRGGACVAFPQTKRFVEYVNDFLFDSDADLTQNWTSTGTGTPTITQPSAADTKDGVVVIATQPTTPAINDQAQFQHKQEFIKLNVANKTTRFVARFQTSRVDGEFFLGLAITDTTIVGGTNFASNIVGFSKVASSTGIDFICAAGAAARTDYAVSGTGTKVTSLATGASALVLAAATWYEVAFEIVNTDTVGGATIRAWINGQPVFLSGSQFDLQVTTCPSTQTLTITLAVATGSANICTLTVDCIEFIAERLAAAS